MKGLLIRHVLVTAAAVFSSACGTPPAERPKVHGQHDRALLAAVRANNVEEVRSLLALGADPDSTESADGLDGRWTALLLASSGGHSEIAEALVRAGADVNRRPGGGFDGYTPLHLAAGWGHVELAKILLEHGANVNARFGLEGTQPHPLYSPCMKRHRESVHRRRALVYRRRN
jgi:ankyrin repeat protein